MVEKLEAIKGGGGSVKLGAVGTISSLMMRELESTTSSVSHHMEAPVSHVSSPTKPSISDDDSSGSVMSASAEHTGPDSMRKKTEGGDQRQIITAKRQKEKSPLKNKDISNASRRIHRKGMDFSGKTRSHKNGPHDQSHICSSEYTHLERTPLREKPKKKGSNVVDVVDINCGNSAGLLSNRLKKLGLSRMSQSFM